MRWYWRNWHGVQLRDPPWISSLPWWHDVRGASGKALIGAHDAERGQCLGELTPIRCRISSLTTRYIGKFYVDKPSKILMPIDIMGDPIKGSLKLFWHHSNIVPKGLMGTYIWHSSCIYFSFLFMNRANFIWCFRAKWKFSVK